MSGISLAPAPFGRPLTAFSVRRLGKLTAIAVAGAITICGTLSDPAHAAERSALVIDANSGKVLHNTAADEPRYPASLTKMMTLYLTFELIERGRLSYSSRIKISAQAAAQPPSKLELEAGDTISVRDAVGALVTKSANDIAVALAEHIGGSEDNFARLMTRRAREIGMSRTTFKNASGLPNSEQTTTARDMITLALRLQDDFPVHYKVFATRSFAYNGASHRNHNTLLYHYRGTDGIKTGYTRMSGFNLVSSVRRDGRHLVAAVFGGNTAGQRNAEMRTILDRAFARATTTRTRQKAPVLVAEPRQIKRPARVASAAPAATAAPLPAASSKVTPARQSTGRSTASADPAPAAEPAAAAVAPEPDNSRIKLATVRQIGVAEHLAERRAARAARADAARTTAAASTEPQARPAEASAAPTPPPATPSSTSASGPTSIAELIATSAREETSSHPSALGMQVNGAIQPPPGPDGPIALAGTMPSAPESSNAMPVREPSSLQDQLSRILADHRPAAADSQPTIDSTSAQQASVPRTERATAAAQATPNAAQAAAKNVTATGGGTFLIQIGAYNSPSEAEKFLKTAQQRTGTLLSRAAPVTETVTRGDRRLYRARFAGLSSAGASEACQELRRQSIDCFVMKPN